MRYKLGGLALSLKLERVSKQQAPAGQYDSPFLARHHQRESAVDSLAPARWSLQIDNIGSKELLMI
jgi:hypothetical protein